MPDDVLRAGFSIVLVLSGVKLVKAPAADTIVEVGAGLALAGVVVWSARSLWTRRLPAHDAA